MRKFLIVALAPASLLSFSIWAQCGVTERVSVSSVGEQGNDWSGRSEARSISADGRYVAFHSEATNLVLSDTNGEVDIFVHDRGTGEITRVSVSSAGEQGSADSGDPALSADGRYVAFHSDARDLVPGDTNWVRDIFVHDRETGETTRVSVSSAGAQGHQDSSSPSISADGRYVAFKSGAGNLVPGDANGCDDVFVHDRQIEETTRVSVSTAGEQGNAHSYGCSISADGRHVAFQSFASNLVPGDTNAWHDVFVHDRQTGETTRVSVSSSGEQGNDGSGYHYVAISGDARYVAFESNASNLVPGDTNGYRDVFVHDRQTGETTRVSVSSTGQQGNKQSEWVSTSVDGRYVGFTSWATNLLPDDTNENSDVFLHDRQTGQTTRASVTSDGEQGNGSSDFPCVMADGRYVAFLSHSSNLVPDDTNGTWDVFVHDRSAVTVSEAKQTADNGQVIVAAGVVSAPLPDAFYFQQDGIASDARVIGLKVPWAGPVTVGKRHIIGGSMATDADGERYLNAAYVDPHTSEWTLDVMPLGMTNKSVGGDDWFYDEPTGAGQKGVKDVFGLNNIGLLVTTWGAFTKLDDSTFTVNDGSGPVKCVVLAGVTLNPAWTYVSVIGISSCYQDGDDLLPLILVGEQADIMPL